MSRREKFAAILPENPRLRRVARRNSREFGHGTGLAFLADMRNAPLMEPEPRRKHPEEEPTRLWLRPALPEAVEPRTVRLPKSNRAMPYLLAPPPWPRGEFRVDPEA